MNSSGPRIVHTRRYWPLTQKYHFCYGNVSRESWKRVALVPLTLTYSAYMFGSTLWISWEVSKFDPRSLPTKNESGVGESNFLFSTPSPPPFRTPKQKYDKPLVSLMSNKQLIHAWTHTPRKSRTQKCSILGAPPHSKTYQSFASAQGARE